MKSLDLERELDSAEQDARGGEYVSAAQRIAGLLAEGDEERRVYEAAFRVMCMGVTGGFNEWDIEGKREFYRHLLMQENCDTRPYLFHHGLANLLTSRSTNTARALVSEFTPTVLELLDEALNGVFDLKPLVLFLIISRSVIPRSISQGRISKLHLQGFPEFSVKDFALPYSIAFNTRAFGENRKDLIVRYPGTTASLIEEGLSIEHLLYLSWLGVGNLFCSLDNRDLLEALSDRLRPESPESSFSAARSLILHFWRPEGVITERVLEELGLEVDLRKIASRMKAHAHCEARSAAAKRNEAFPRQVIHGLRNSFPLAIAVPRLGKKVVRVAVCVSGQLRGYRKAFPSWLRWFLSSVDFDIFVHSWERIGRAGAQPWRETLPFSGPEFCAKWRQIGLIEGYDVMQARYPTLFRDLDVGNKVAESELIEFYNAKAVALEDEASKPFVSFSNQDKMHYKIHAAHQMAMESGVEYDLFVRLRPDLSLGIRAFDWHDMAEACRANALLYCEAAFGVHYGQPAIGDQIAVAGVETLQVYAQTWKIHHKLASLRLIAFPQNLTGHISLAQVCWLNRIRAARLPVRLGGLNDPDTMLSSEIFTAISKDSSGRWDSTDRALLDALTKDGDKHLR